MSSWVILNCILRLTLTVMMTFGIVWFEHWLTKAERIGMGIMGGSGLLTVPVIFFTAKHIETPYDGWAACLFTLGAIVFFSGWMYRKRLHDVANHRTMAAARRHAAQKGNR